MTTLRGGTTTLPHYEFSLVARPIGAYHVPKPDEIAFLQVSSSHTTVPILRTTPLTCANNKWYGTPVPLGSKPQVRGSYHRTPYGVASSWYAATREVGRHQIPRFQEVPMTDRRCTPPAGVNFQRLRPYLEDALLHQKNKRTAVAIAQRLDRNQWRAIAQFDVTGDDLDQVDLDSFSIRVEVETSDGWAHLCTVHWTQLGMEWSDVTAAWDEVLRQHREGIQPGGPNDPGRREEWD